MAGVDPLNQFPNSKMAQAVKNGQSRFRSVDAPSTIVGAQDNLAIGSATQLTVPATATYCVIQALSGPAYLTFDGSTPSGSNYAETLAQGLTMNLYGQSMTSLKIIGSSISVTYYR
jgi:hypothetical protein